MTPRNNPIERIDAVTLHKVRVTQEPGVVREVTDAELTDLYRQGILYSFEHTDEAKEIVPSTYKAPAKWADAKKGETTISAPDAMTEPTAAPVAANTDTQEV